MFQIPKADHLMQPLKDGWYKASLIKCKWISTVTSGMRIGESIPNPFFQFFWRIDDGEMKGRIITTHIVFAERSIMYWPQQGLKVMRICEQLEVEYSQEAEVCALMLSKEGRNKTRLCLFVSEKNENNGRIYTRLKYITKEKNATDEMLNDDDDVVNDTPF